MIDHITPAKKDVETRPIPSIIIYPSYKRIGQATIYCHCRY